MILTRKFQIQYSRMNQTLSNFRSQEPGSLVIWINIENDIADAAELNVIANDLLAYARYNAFRRYPIRAADIEGTLAGTTAYEDASEIAQNWEKVYSKREDVMGVYMEERYRVE